MTAKSLLLMLTATIFCSEVSCADTSQEQALHQAYPELMNHKEISEFGNLVAEAHLIHFFQGTGPFTLFVPSNEAVEQLGKDTLDNYKKPENLDALINLINYHVVLGEYPPDALKTRAYRTVNGKEISVRVEGDNIFVNDAKVIKKGIKGPNGVGYVIDKVLVP